MRVTATLTFADREPAHKDGCVAAPQKNLHIHAVVTRTLYQQECNAFIKPYDHQNVYHNKAS
jgi:hypothetical protein